MISVEALSKRIDERLNKTGRNEGFKIPPATKVRAINAAQLKLIDSISGINNPARAGLQGLDKRFDQVSFLFEVSEPLPSVTNSELPNRATVDMTVLDNLPGNKSYMYYVSSITKADKKECKGIVLINNLVSVKQIDNSELQHTQKSSFEWRHQNVALIGDLLVLSTDGTYDPKETIITYVRYPKEVDLVGYTRNGIASTTVDSEFPKHLENMLLDFTIIELSQQLDNVNQNLFSQQNRQTYE